MNQLLLSLLACFEGPPVPAEIVEEVAPSLSALGHPQATYQDVEVVNFSTGSPEGGQRYVDLNIRYLRPGRPAPNAMLVRLYEQSLTPCKISIDVLSDDGPAPILLDNGLASSAIGTELCEKVEKSGQNKL